MTDAENGKRAGFRWLALDSSTSNLTIAITEDRRLLAESHSLSERNHSIRLMPAVEELLKSLNMKMEHIQGIAAGQGPGSYTGVRIAVTVAKTMAWALGLPLVGVSSLEALARGAGRRFAGERGSRQWIVPVMDARRGQAYTGLYADEPGSGGCLEQDGIRLMASWLEAIADRLAKERDHPPARVIFAGDVEPFLDLIRSFRPSWPGGKGEVRYAAQLVEAYDVGMLADARYLRGECDPVHDFGPNYTQMAEAEKKWLAART